MKNIKEEYPLLFKNDEEVVNEKFKSAWKKARSIAKILKDKYDAETVIVFGSLLDKQRFHKKSDIDLAVMGINDKKFYKAYGEITAKFTGINIDLVDVKDCEKSLLTVIEKEGIKIE